MKLVLFALVLYLHEPELQHFKKEYTLSADFAFLAKN